MEALKRCEWCDKLLPLKPGQPKGRFCNRSCSAKWRMRQPEILAKVHAPEVAAKRGRKRSVWLRSDDPKAKAEIQRIRDLNPMSRPEVRAKVSAKLRAMGHRPHKRGGNGKGPTLAQRVLWELLGADWYLEYSVSLGPRRKGYPTAYKVDIASPAQRLAIEVDGSSHYSRKEQDAKKDAMLAVLGWRVLRFWNQEVLSSALSVVAQIQFSSMTLK